MSLPNTTDKVTEEVFTTILRTVQNKMVYVCVIEAQHFSTNERGEVLIYCHTYNHLVACPRIQKMKRKVYVYASD